MHLKKRVINIKQAIFDERTYVKDGVLHINKQELLEVAHDFNFKHVDVELVHPGEDCRITNVADCVYPMYKIGEGESTFPGIVDPIKRVGTGETIEMRGVSVTEVTYRTLKIPSVLNMSGDIAKMSPTLPNLVHVCLLAEASDTASDNEYFNSINIASKKVAKYLAKCAMDCEPDTIEEYSLDPNVDPSLPKVVYVFQIFSHAALTDNVYYGDGCASMLPIIVHPNEVLDGALLFRDYYQTLNASPSCILVNHPVILELMSRHGKDLNFAGLILTNTPAEVDNKRRNAMMCAGLAKYHLGADCAIVTKEGGGHPQVDLGLNCDALEALGIKTVILLTEMLSAGSPIDELTLFSTPNADAMVSNGCLDNATLFFESTERVVGPTSLHSFRLAPVDATLSFSVAEFRVQRDALSQIGNSELTTILF